jgi:Thioredoxin
MLKALALVAASLTAGAAAPLRPPVVAASRALRPLDYASFYAQGISFAEFLDRARMLRDEWRDNYADATIEDEPLARARALNSRWQLLVVADDSCHDSVNTVPYLAKLTELVPEKLSMRIVTSEVGQAVKDAHQTPDGRAATPTIVVLDSQGAPKGVFIERPAALLRYIEERGQGLYPDQVRDLRHRWYAEDKGRHAIAEILEIIEK